MILSGLKIAEEVKAGRIFISDFDEKRLNPNSYNLRLADEIMLYKDRQLDMAKQNEYITMKIPESGLLLLPGILYLGRTMERTRTEGYVPMLEGRSSVGRLGLTIHVTAGFGDVGFDGFWTLELHVVQPLRIYPGVEICQIYYHTMDGDYVPYTGGKYQGNIGIQPSLLWSEFTGGR